MFSRLNDAIAEMRFDMYVMTVAATETISSNPLTKNSITGSSRFIAPASKPTATFNSSMIARDDTTFAIRFARITMMFATTGNSRWNTCVKIGMTGSSAFDKIGMSAFAIPAKDVMTAASGCIAVLISSLIGSISALKTPSSGVSTASTIPSSGPVSCFTSSTTRPPIFSSIGVSGVRIP